MSGMYDRDEEDDPFHCDNEKDDDPFHLDESDEENHQETVHKYIKHGKSKQNNMKSTADKTAIDWSKEYPTIQTGDWNKGITVIPGSNPYVSDSEYTEELNGFHCSSCEFATKTRRWVKRHIRRRHRDAPRMFQCPYCPYKSLYDLRSHIIFHHTAESDIQWFRCNECEYKGKTRNTLFSHIKNKHTVPYQMIDYKCKKCPKMYKRAATLKQHILQVHEKHNVKKIKCLECDYKCTLAEQLKNHSEVFHSDHDNLETLKCSKCKYITKFKYCLMNHIRQSHRDVKYQCDKCAYKTKVSAHFKLHLINHKAVKDEVDLKFCCDKCAYKTYRFNNLTVHKLNHLKPEETQYFYCYHCSFKAKRKDNLKTHVLRHLKHDEITLACYICEFSTVKRHLLVHHIEKHSKEMSRRRKLVSVSTVSDKQSEEMKKCNVNVSLLGRTP